MAKGTNGRENCQEAWAEIGHRCRLPVVYPVPKEQVGHRAHKEVHHVLPEDAAGQEYAGSSSLGYWVREFRILDLGLQDEVRGSPELRDWVWLRRRRRSNAGACSTYP